MPQKKYLLRPKIIKWSNLEIEGLPFPVGGMDGSFGIVLVYETVEDFYKNNPGEKPLIVEAKPQERTL